MVIFDLETTGTNVFDAEIITGHFIYVDKNLQTRSEFTLQCNPLKWSYDAEKIHGITKEEASKYKKFSEVYLDLLNWLEAYDVNEAWMHTNAKMFGKLTYFDHAILRLRMGDMGDVPYFLIEKIRPYSTHSLAKVLQNHFNFEGFSLDLICKRLGIQLKHHDAQSDAIACLEIIKQLLPMTNREALYNYEREVSNEPTGKTKRSNVRQK
jgi:DNA polymerase III epsilon subunit-like protein